MSTDPWSDGNEGDDEGSSYPPIRIDRAHPGTSRLGIKVEGISDVLEGDYGDYVLVSGELLYQVDAVGGKQDDPEPAPEVGETVQFLIPFKNDDPKVMGHIQEEIDKALRRTKAGRGFLKVGDTFHVKLVELQAKNSKGKAYPKDKQFGKHAVKVERPAPDFPEGDDLPF
jgi:hypothetical protein